MAAPIQKRQTTATNATSNIPKVGASRQRRVGSPRMGPLAVLVVALLLAPPEVEKVEPPSWWPGHSLNPVRVMVRGKGLGGARIESAGTGLVASGVRVNQAGTYLFGDLRIDPRAEPGVRKLRIRTPAGVTEAAFELLKPLPREGRFRGFSPDDVIYLILPDRFADGDASNDDPPASKG